MWIILARLDELQENQECIKIKHEELLVKADESQRNQECIANTLSGIVESFKVTTDESMNKKGESNEVLEKSKESDKEITIKVQVDDTIKNKPKRKETRACFECGKIGHIIRNCFIRANKRNGKKVGYKQTRDQTYVSPLTRLRRKSDDEEVYGENEVEAEYQDE